MNYTYSGSNNGIDCNDGSTAALTRQMSDGTWTYSRSADWTTTTVTDPSPQHNQAVYTFSAATAPAYETLRQHYAGSAVPANLLKTVQTCYNGQACGQVPTLPITQTDVYTTLVPMSQSSRLTTTYDSYGNVTDVKQYDFGASVATVDIVTPVGSWVNGTGCVAVASSINNPTCYRNIYDGSAALQFSETFTYDSKGNLTTHVVGTTTAGIGGPTLRNSATYNTSGTITNGTLASTTDVNGAVTHYYYNGTGGCTNGLLTSMTNALNQTTSMQWNCNIGKMTQTTDPNSQSITNVTYDSLLRPTSMTDPTGIVFNRAYNDSGGWWDSGWFTRFGTNSDTTLLTWFDGYGRPSQTGHAHDSAWSGWDYVPIYRDANGRVSQVYQPCTTSGGTCPPATGAYTTQTYDALNRPLITTDGGGGTITRSYSGRDVLVVLPAPAGEVVKQTQYEFDGLGRVKSACQLSSASGSGPCNQDMGGTGFLTTYSYDVLGRVMQVTKNAQSSTTQTRSFTYDALGRKLTETYPESGTTTYTYDTWPTGNVCWYTANNAGDLLTKKDNAGNMTCYLHDQLHRLTDAAGWVNGTGWRGPCQRLRYDNTSNGLHTVPTALSGQSQCRRASYRNRNRWCINR